MALLELLSSLSLLVASYVLASQIAMSDMDYKDLLWLSLLTITAAFATVKIFTIQHDCGHLSFTGSSRIDKLLGRFCSLATFIPFDAWRTEHQEHHAAFCDISNRTLGDIYLMTVEEYADSSFSKRILYCVFRSKLFVLGIAPLGYLLIRCRFSPSSRLKMNRSTLLTSLCLSAFWGVLVNQDIISMPVLFAVLHIAGTVAMLIFFNEHQFDSSYWRPSEDWDFFRASVEGSSVIDLPAPLSWLTGNIGYHSIHHLMPRIPSYNLRRAFIETKHIFPHSTLKLRHALKPVGFLLWSEDENRIVRTF